MADKKKLPSEVSVKGVAAHCWLAKPDTRFSEDKPYFKVKLVVRKDDLKNEVARLQNGRERIDGETWLKHLQEMADEGGKNSPVKDGDKIVYGKKHDKAGQPNEDFAGSWVIEFKGQRQPRFADSRGNELPEGVFPFFGDLIRVAYRPNIYEGLGGGLSLWPNEVRIIDKRAGGVDFGDDDEDGYVAKASDARPAATETKADDNNGDF